jgi:hypothetical protein
MGPETLRLPADKEISETPRVRKTVNRILQVCILCRTLYDKDGSMKRLHEAGICIEGSTELTCRVCGAFDSHEPDCPKRTWPPALPKKAAAKTLREIRELGERFKL